MKHKNIKQYAILHLVFIIVISGYYLFDLQKSIVFDSSTTRRNIQVFRDENAEGTFSKEQVEEILIDILIPLEEDIPEGSALHLNTSKEDRLKVLERHIKDERVLAIMNAKSFDTEEGRIFLVEIKDKYLEKGLEFPGVPSATPLQMTVEEWMMDVYYYLKHQVGNDKILEEPFFIEDKTTEEIQKQIDIYVEFAKERNIILPPSPTVESEQNKELTNKNTIIEAYLNGELRKITNVSQQQKISILECSPKPEEIQKSVNSGDFTTAESQIVLKKISNCYEILNLTYVPPTQNSSVVPLNPVSTKQVLEAGAQSTVMESYFASETRKLQRLSEMNNIEVQNCLPSENQIRAATESDSFSSTKSSIVLGKIKDCYSLFKMDFSPPE